MIEKDTNHRLKKKVGPASNPAAREITNTYLPPPDQPPLTPVLPGGGDMTIELNLDEVDVYDLNDPDDAPLVGATGCTAWYEVIYVNGLRLSERYIGTTCPPTIGGGGFDPLPNNPNYKDCYAEASKKRARCERTARIATAIMFAVAAGTMAANMAGTAGALTWAVIIAFEAQAIKITVDYNLCLQDADEDLRDCLRDQQQHP